MPDLVLGPTLRHVDATSATIWVETDGPGQVEILGTRTATFHVAGHHYALCLLEGLPSASTTPYDVRLIDPDGTSVLVWPPTGSTYPASRIRTLGRDEPLSLVFGSCRYARPATAGGDLPPDALDAYAVRMAEQDEASWPDALLLLGDQVYADETTEDTRTYLAGRRDLSQPPGVEVADFEEYTRLYLESWTDPDVRWLLSTVPSSMIFDDHDVRDDWNTSHAWRLEMQATSWWQPRIEGALMSYWIYQHLGNLGPEELAADETYAAVQAADDGEAVLREFARRADEEADGRKGTRWSYRRDFGRTRLLVVDTRCGRILEGRRSMVGENEFDWISEQAHADIDHLLVGSSLPWLMAPALHDVEAWNEALCSRFEGRWFGRLSEKFRQAADLEHWSAFGASFAGLAGLFADVGRGEQAPATISVLSGDVHHAYVARAVFPETVDTKVFQLTCSPVHNEVPGFMKVGFRLGWSRFAHTLTRTWNRLFAVPAPPLRWRKQVGPYFANQLATVTLSGRSASFRLEGTEVGPAGPRLRRLADVELSGAG